MPNPTFNPNTYAGERYIDIFGPAIVDPSGLIDQGAATPVETKFKEVIQDVTDSVNFQTPNPSFNDQGTTANVNENVLEVVPYEVMKEINFQDVYKNWLSQNLSKGAMEDYKDPRNPSLMDAFLSKVYIPKMKALNSYLIMNGKTGAPSGLGTIGFSASYTGLYPRMIADASVNKITANIDEINVDSVTKGTTTTLTVASGDAANLEAGDIVSIRGALGTGWVDDLNGEFTVLETTDTTVVIDLDSDALTSEDYTADSADIRYINKSNLIKVLSQVYNQVPVAIRRKPGTKIILPEHLRLAWQFANATVSQNEASYFRGEYNFRFIDRDIIFADFAPENTVGIWHKDNVFLGHDLLGDDASADVVWLGDTTLDQVYRLKARIKTGNHLSRSDEITLYHP